MSKCPKFKAMNFAAKKIACRKGALCFHCLSTKHAIKDCETNKGKLCDIGGCKAYHHPLLHPDKDRVYFEHSDELDKPLNEKEEEELLHLIESETKDYDRVMHIASPGAISLQTIVLKATSGMTTAKTVALIDTGSTMTCVDEDFAKRMKFPVVAQREGKVLNYLDRKVKIEGLQDLVQIQISSVDNDITQTIEAWTIKGLAEGCGIVDWSKEKRKFPHLKIINFPELPNDPKIQILFGVNTTKMFISKKTIVNEKNWDDPIAMRTFLGWTCIGKSGSHDVKQKSLKKHFVNVIFRPLHEQNMK